MGHDDVVASMVLELRRGTLVMLVLGQLREPAYGYALVKSLADHGIPIEANTLYPLMRRLESQGLLTSMWDNGGSKPRKYYQTTPQGLDVLRAVESQWHALCDGVNALLNTDASLPVAAKEVDASLNTQNAPNPGFSADADRKEGTHAPR